MCAYHAAIPSFKQFVYELSCPRILEVGVDRGTTFVPMAVFLARTKDAFHLVGIDVMLQESLLITMSHIERDSQQRIDIVRANSLEALPKLVEAGFKFDLILLDGDHNYHTVSNELRLVSSLAEKNSLIVVDDYNGRWANRDLFYSERPEYAECRNTTQRIETSKHGVRAAVDDFLATSCAWTTLIKNDHMDFVVLKRKGAE